MPTLVIVKSGGEEWGDSPEGLSLVRSQRARSNVCRTPQTETCGLNTYTPPRLLPARVFTVGRERTAEMEPTTYCFPHRPVASSVIAFVGIIIWEKRWEADQTLQRHWFSQFGWKREIRLAHNKTTKITIVRARRPIL